MSKQVFTVESLREIWLTVRFGDR